MAFLTEDEMYRSSSQYRLWSFTRPSLASLRSSTNALAADSVRSAIHSLHAQRSQSKEEIGTGNGKDGDLATLQPPPEVDCLTVEEEQKLVGFYCWKAIELADFCEFPTNVKATAVQFMKRFYLSNSPMTYHPKEIIPCAIFLATKTENHYISLKRFVSKLQKITAEDIVAPEFLLTQGLRFTFDVRHPQRALEGGFMELMTMANGTGVVRPVSDATAKDLQSAIKDIPPVDKNLKADIVKRIGAAHDKAKDVLKTRALLTDVYFLYTPSQIWLASLFLVDEPLALFYVDSKIPTFSPIKQKLKISIRACADLLRSSPSTKPGKVDLAELTQIDKKLYKCRNPEKIDLVSINKAQKRDSEGKNGNDLDEKVVKKRKLERERSEKEADDLFGPTIPIQTGR